MVGASFHVSHQSNPTTKWGKNERKKVHSQIIELQNP